MARRIAIVLASWILCFAIFQLLLAGLERETIGDRAIRLRHKAEVAKPILEHWDESIKTSNRKRFESKKTASFKVDKLPDLDYDYQELYSGSIPIDNSDSSRKLFFVFHPKLGAPTEDLTIWFNGGPGCSSLEGFLQENGPFTWVWGQYTGLPNPYTWSRLTNMLWVEFPVGAGFSQGKVTAMSQEDIAKDFLGFFKNFQETFGIKNFNIYVAGESYAGRYVPYVSDAMLKTNDTEYFNLKGALMYDPAIGKYDYASQAVVTVPYIEQYNQFLNLNASLVRDLQLAHKKCGYEDYFNKYMTFPATGLQPPLAEPYANSDSDDESCDVWSRAFRAAFQPNPCFNVYRITDTCPLLFDPLSYPTTMKYNYAGFYGPYFNRRSVKEAMHAPLNVNWTSCTGPVFARVPTNRGQYENGDLSADPIQEVLPHVIEKTNRVLIAGGDWDFELMNNGTLLAIQNMTWNGKLGFQQAPQEEVNIDLPELQWNSTYYDIGWKSRAAQPQGTMGTQHFERGLLWTTTRQCGHMQPQFQPRVSYRHLQWLLGHIDKL